MALPIVHSPHYDANFSADHRFPMAKYSHLATVLAQRGLVPEGFHVPVPAAAELLALAHDAAYVAQVIDGTVPELIEKLIGFPVSARVALRARTATAGTIMAAELALRHGIACNTAGGSHHARRAHGAGFCTFNDVGVAATHLVRIKAVSRVMVFDLDVHQGDGTADIFTKDPQVFTVSVHAEKNYPNDKIASDMDVALPDRVRDDAYLETVDDTLHRATAAFRPDLVFYNAGVDPHEEDRLGRLCLSDAGLRRRDRKVIDFFRSRNIPVCGVIGGGYGKDAEAIARRHAILFEVASDFS
jgi:acetoin utilization deacetylase AcuC-like enzyme